MLQILPHFLKLFFLSLLMGLSSQSMAQPSNTRPAGWGLGSHSKNVTPNYAVAYPKNQVNQFKITVSPGNWTAMQDNMTKLYGEPGQGFPGKPHESKPLEAEAFPSFSSEKPMWVEATIEFNNKKWTHVGVRFKGNSSLFSSWFSKSPKLPFKVDFDQFEDQYPSIKNQRFYGFKQLSLGNVFGDSTYVRERFAYNFFEKLGLAAAKTAYYSLTVNYGEGDIHFGVYTAIEVIDDTAILRYFKSDDGNIYEGDGQGVTFSAGTTEEKIEQSFEKESNKLDADWGDVHNLFNIIHSEQRLKNKSLWRKELKNIFDVSTFLKWLAASAVIEHWDTYGAMTHNFYLYNNPKTGLLTWISWDHNFILGTSSFGGFGSKNFNEDTVGLPSSPPTGGGPGGGLNQNVTFAKDEVTEKWPLIRFLLDDPVFKNEYLGHLSQLSFQGFQPGSIKQSMIKNARLVEPFLNLSPEEKKSYDEDLDELIQHVYQRQKDLKLFLTR